MSNEQLLREAASEALLTLDGIADTNPRDKADFENKDEWITWAKSRAKWAADKLREPIARELYAERVLKQMLEQDTAALSQPTAASGETVPLAWQNTREGLMAYVLQDDLHNRLTPRVVDIAYSAFMSGASGKNKDDGGKCDWFNDTKPMVMAAIDKIRSELHATPPASQPQALPRLCVDDSHMASLIEAAIEGHADTRDAMRWLVRQIASQPQATPADPAQAVADAVADEFEPGHWTISAQRAIQEHPQYVLKLLARLKRLESEQAQAVELPEPFGYVSDGFADGLHFSHKPWPEMHEMLHSTAPVYSSAQMRAALSARGLEVKP